MENLKKLWSQKIYIYLFFLGMMGRLAVYVGPDRLPYIKILMGVTIGCMILGEKLPKAFKEHFNSIMGKIEKGPNG